MAGTLLLQIPLPRLTPTLFLVSSTADQESLLLVPTRPSSLAEQRVKGTEKHQAVLALDYAVWRQLIELYEIREPLIPHRREEGDVSDDGSDDD